MVDPVSDGGLGLDPATVAEMVGHDDGGYLIATVYTKLGQRSALARAQQAMAATRTDTPPPSLATCASWASSIAIHTPGVARARSRREAPPSGSAPLPLLRSVRTGKPVLGRLTVRSEHPGSARAGFDHAPGNGRRTEQDLLGSVERGEPPALLAGREHVALHGRLDHETGVRMARRYALGNLLLIAGSQRVGSRMSLSSDRDLSPRCAAAEKQIGEFGEALGLVIWVGLYRHNRQRMTRLASQWHRDRLCKRPANVLGRRCKRPAKTRPPKPRETGRSNPPPVFPGFFAYVRWLSPTTNQSGRMVGFGSGAGVQSGRVRFRGRAALFRLSLAMDGLREAG
jgi:hypothetical protein